MLVLIQLLSHMSYQPHLTVVHIFLFESLFSPGWFPPTSLISLQRYYSISLEWNLGQISGSRGGNWLLKDTRESFGCDEMFLILVMVVISLYIFVINHQNLHLKREDFTELTFYIHKGDS